MGLGLALISTQPDKSDTYDVYDVANEIEERVTLPSEKGGVIEAQACIYWVGGGRTKHDAKRGDPWTCQKLIRFEGSEYSATGIMVQKTWGSEGKSSQLIPAS